MGDKIITTSDKCLPPFVKIMGHGRTSLLDCIIKNKSSEPRGIAEAAGVFKVSVPVNGMFLSCVVLDTPGHEAFGSLRAPGKRATDIAIAIIVVDIGRPIPPQTFTAIAHAKASDVPIIIAINKDGASPVHELSSIGLRQDWGGDFPVVQISVSNGDNVDVLMQTVMHVAAIQVNPHECSASSFLDQGIGMKAGIGTKAGLASYRHAVMEGIRLIRMGETIHAVRFDTRKREMNDAGLKSCTGDLFSLLPDDLQMAIFSRVEVKEIMNLRLVCKSFRSIVEDPDFVKTQLEYSRSICRSFLAWRYSGDIDKIFCKCYWKYDVMRSTESTELSAFEPACLLKFLGSNDGLVFLARGESLILFNASLKRCLKVEKEGKLPCSVAVGFQGKNTVVVGMFTCGGKLEFHIVRLSTEMWERFHMAQLDEFDTVSMKNMLVGRLFHCLSQKRGSVQRVLLTVDIEAGSLTVAELPEAVHQVASLGEYKGLLALFDMVDDHERRGCNVWQRNSANDSWENLMWIDLSISSRDSEIGCLALNKFLAKTQTEIFVYHLMKAGGLPVHPFQCHHIRDIYSYPESILLCQYGRDPAAYDLDPDFEDSLWFLD